MKIFEWDLNLWNTNDGSIQDAKDEYYITAYPVSDDNSVIGGHNLYISLNLSEVEVIYLEALGIDLQDSWTACDVFIQDYELPPRIMQWLEGLPSDSEEIPN